jgi:hypothetical protein
MGPCEELVFHDVSPAHYEKLVAKSHAVGIDLSGTSGGALRHGVEVIWSYDPSTGRLMIQCIQTPFYLSCQDVNQRIHNVVTESLR